MPSVPCSTVLAAKKCNIESVLAFPLLDPKFSAYFKKYQIRDKVQVYYHYLPPANMCKKTTFYYTCGDQYRQRIRCDRSYYDVFASCQTTYYKSVI